jgi:hypothetical protein
MPTVEHVHHPKLFVSCDTCHCAFVICHSDPSRLLRESMNVDMVCHRDDKHGHFVENLIRMRRLTSETVESAALSLESVDDLENVSEAHKIGKIKFTSNEVTVFLFACSVYVTASRMTDSKKDFKTPRVSS